MKIQLRIITEQCKRGRLSDENAYMLEDLGVNTDKAIKCNLAYNNNKLDREKITLDVENCSLDCIHVMVGEIIIRFKRTEDKYVCDKIYEHTVNTKIPLMWINAIYKNGLNSDMVNEIISSSVEIIE